MSIKHNYSDEELIEIMKTSVQLGLRKYRIYDAKNHNRFIEEYDLDNPPPAIFGAFMAFAITYDYLVKSLIIHKKYVAVYVYPVTFEEYCNRIFQQTKELKKHVN